MPPAPVPERTPCNTLPEWNQHVKDAMLIVDQPETEQNWDRMERAFLVLASVVRGGAYKLDADFVPGVRTIARPATNAILSDRSRLSGTAVELLTVIGARMGAKFEPLIPLYIPTILKLCTRSGKIYVNRAQNCLKLFAAYCRVPPLVALLKESITDKSVTLRFAATDALHDLLSTSVRDGLPRRGKWVEDVEHIIKITSRDASPETRKMSRRAFASYCQLWPDRVADFVGPLSPTTRRYLDINDSATAESSKKAYQMATPSHARRTPTLSRAKSTTALVLRPTPVLVESHTRTVSVQTVQLAGEPTRPLLRTVRSTNFRDGTSGAKHATRPLSREQPRHQIQPLVYETTRPRSVASHRHERPPSSRSIKEADVVPVAEAAPAPNSAPTPLSDAMSASANTRSGARLNAPVRERQYPFTGPGFVPKSRREREAEAVRIPLPPSPTSSHQSLPQVPVILPSEPVTEPSIPKELTPPPSVAPPPEVEPVTSKQASIVSTGKKFAASLVNKLQPSFRPRRGGAKVDLSANNHTQPQAQARKVSAFGAPAVITTVQPVGAPPAPVGPPPAAGTTTRGAPKNKPTLHIMAPPGTGSRSAASSVSSRSVSAHIAVAVAAANSAVGPGNAESVSHPSKPAGSSRVVSNPAPSAPKPTLTHKTDRPPKPATHNHEPRIRNATGMTLSQLLKQKPPVHKKGFAPTNKLRSAKSSANLKGAVLSAQKQQPPSFDQKSSKVEPEIVACVSLPSSSEGEVAHPPPVGVPLPPSPVVAAAQLDVGLTLEESQHHTFPTIESIKERLSDVLGSQSPSSDSALACSVALAVAPIPCVHGRTESEPELTLNDLELLPHTPPTLISTQAVSIIEDLGGSDDPDITPIAETGVALASEFIIPASHPSSPAKTGAEKLSRELEMRTVLREVGTNMDL